MIFKRSTTTYGETPAPETPYQRAAQVWDDRIGSARVQARNWRLMAFGCLALAIGLSGGGVWQAGRSTITPYVVEVDTLGEVRAVGPAITAYEPMRRSPGTWRVSSKTSVRCLSTRLSCGRTGYALMTTPPIAPRLRSTTMRGTMIRSAKSAGGPSPSR